MAKLKTYIARLKPTLQAIGADIQALRANKEDVSNKATNLNSPNHEEYPTTKTVADALEDVDGGEIIRLSNTTFANKNFLPEEFGTYSFLFSLSSLAEKIIGTRSVLIGGLIDFDNGSGDIVAIGHNIKSGQFSVALGTNIDSSGIRSVSLGTQTKATGPNGTALGRFAEALGAYSVAIGRTKADGGYDVAIGSEAISEGYMAVAIGRMSRAIADRTTSIGLESESKGNFSTAIGSQSVASSFREVNIGSYPTEYTPNSLTSANPADRAVNFSGGTSENSRKDFLTILKSGLAFLPEQTIALIAESAKAIITREYLEAELEKVRSKTILKPSNFLIDDSLNNAVVISENVTMTVNAASMEGWSDEFKTAITNDGNNRAVLSLQGSKTYRVNDNPITSVNANFYIPTGGTITIIRKAKNSYLVKGDLVPIDSEIS